MSRFNFKQVGGARKYRKWNMWDEGDYVVGVLKDTYIDKFKKECFLVEVIEADFKKTDESFKEGDLVGLNHAGGLVFSLKDVPMGSVVRIEYNGKDILDSGEYEGSEVHTFKVGVDESTLDAAEVKKVQDGQATGEAEETEEDGEDYEL